MSASGLIIGAPRSGSGKTSVTIGLLRAFARRGIAVRGAKSGPDYIDPGFHAAATGRPGVNLDSWAMPPSLLAGACRSKPQTAPTWSSSKAPWACSTAFRASRAARARRPTLRGFTGLPVLLVLDVSGQSQTAAAIAKGFATYDPGVTIAGVVLNRRGQRAAPAACRRGDRGDRPAGRRRDHARPDAVAARAPSRPGAGRASMPRSKRFIDRLADVMETLARPRRGPGAGRAVRRRRRRFLARLAAARPAHRARRGRRLHLRLSACRRRTGARPGAETGAVLAARRRAAAGQLRRLLAAGRLSGTACRRASRRPAHFRAGMQRFAATRPVHGECGGFMVLGKTLEDADGEDSRNARPARPCHELRQAPDEPRLPPGAAARRLPARARPARRSAATNSTTRR